MVRFQWTRKRKVLFFLTTQIVILPILYHLRGDSLDRTQRALAGPGAIDCGFVSGVDQTDDEFYGNRTPMDTWITVAFKAHKPFYARFNARVSPDFPPKDLT